MYTSKNVKQHYMHKVNFLFLYFSIFFFVLFNFIDECGKIILDHCLNVHWWLQSNCFLFIYLLNTNDKQYHHNIFMVSFFCPFGINNHFPPLPYIYIALFTYIACSSYVYLFPQFQNFYEKSFTFNLILSQDRIEGFDKIKI